MNGPGAVPDPSPAAPAVFAEPSRFDPGPTGTVDAWLALLDFAPSRVARLLEVLDPEERARAARFHFDDDRARYVGAHAAARAILARCLACAPAAVPFSILPSGKPALASPHGDWRFNLSHSGRASLVVVARSLDVGADIESAVPSFPFDEIARRFFSPSESASLASAPPRGRAAFFYRLWTSKEACLKATGRGLSGLDDLNRLGPSGLFVQPLPVPAPYFASLAAVGTPSDVRLFLLPDEWQSL